MCFDPFPDRFPRSGLVGLIIVARQHVDFQIWRLAETWYLMSAVGNCAASSIAVSFLLFARALCGDEVDVEGVNGPKRPGGGLPVKVSER